MNSRAHRLWSIGRAGGLRYFALYARRRLLCAALARSDSRIARSPVARARSLALRGRIARIEATLVDIERARSIVRPWAMTTSRFTADENRTWWNNHDWSAFGEEWTPSSTWKAAICERFLTPYVPEGGTVLEIGPGGGRWTEVLRNRAAKVFVLEVSERALAVCRKRFVGCENIQYMLGDGRSVALPNASLDAIWSYDVFVHVNPVDAHSYFSEFGRLLRPGAHAVVHHPGHGSASERKQEHRSDLTDAMVVRFANESGLEVVFQTTELVNRGDALTVVRRPV